MSDRTETSSKSSVDLASIIGLGLALLAILGGQALEGGSIESIL